MNFFIRQALVSDASSIHELNVNALGYDYPLCKTIDNINRISEKPEHIILVAESYGRVIGYIHAEDYEVIYAPRQKNILGLAVGEEHRRMGVGSALLRAVEVWARETGAQGVRLASGATRINAHSFYKSLGYVSDKSQLRFTKFF